MVPFRLKEIALICLSGGGPAILIRADISMTPGVSSQANGAKLCVKDAVRVHWRLSNWGSETELVWIDVQRLNPSSGTPDHDRVARFDVFQYGYDHEHDEHNRMGEPSPSLELVHPVHKSLERVHSLIQSRHDGPFKTPDIETAEWRLADDGRSSMILKLSEPTNRPALETAVDLNNAIAITIMTDHDDTPVKMQTGRGVWSPDGDALTITEMDSDSWKAAVAAISAGTLRATLRKKLLVGATLSTGRPGGFVDDESSSGELRGTLTMRMSSPGRFGARLFVGEKLDSTSARFVDVELCPEQVVVGDDAKPTDSSPGPGRALATLPSPFFSVGGVLAMPGDRWLKVPSGLFPAQRGPIPKGDLGEKGMTSGRCGSWTLAFWIYLADNADGSLFYKGDDARATTTTGKTPSAWLCPHSNRIAVRVTSNTKNDNDNNIIGADSTVAISAGSWNHIAFSFDNNTEGTFSATIFVNGVVDISVAFREADVVGNDGPLHFGRDLTSPGTRSLVSLLRLWGEPLSREQIKAIFEASRPLFYGECSNALASSYPAIRAVTLVTSSHGSYQDRSQDPSQEQLGVAAYETANMATEKCTPLSERQDMYRIAAEAGHAESRVRYASLLLAGREQLDGDGDGGEGSSCGRETETADVRTTAEDRWNAGAVTTAVEQLELAVRDGSYRAAFMLATLMLSGIGGTAAHGLPAPGCRRCHAYRVAPAFQLAGVGVGAAVLDQWASITWEEGERRRESSTGSSRTWSVPTTARAIGLLHFAAVGGHPEAQVALGLRYREGNGVQRDVEAAAWYLACASSVSYARYHLVGQQPIVEKQRLTEANEEVVSAGQLGEEDGLIQYQVHRANQGDVPSQIALGELFYWGARGVPRDQVRALNYFTAAADAGDNTARCAAAVSQADAFRRLLPDWTYQGMHLKGEGTVANHVRAVELYETAAEESHVRALNGLGHEYYTGRALPRNFTKAYEYFERAASMKQDADSLFNAAHCLNTGTGTDQDLERAAELFRLGAAWGHVDCAYELASMAVEGRGVERSAADAAMYLQIVAQVGPWGRRVREAFDCYLRGDPLCAIALYAQASELGYEVAASNAAFILDRGKIRLDGEAFKVVGQLDGGGEDEHTGSSPAPVWVDTMSIRFHTMAAAKGYHPSFLAIGDAFFYGRGGLPRDPAAACWWYSRASSLGLVRGSYNLGYMHEHGLGVPQDYDLAWTYYDRARRNVADVAGVDQRLDGMPIELLIAFARIRLFVNRLSGGGVGRIWQRQDGDEHPTSTKEWLPQWPLLAAITNTMQACATWIGGMWKPARVLNHLESTEDPLRGGLRPRASFGLPEKLSFFATADNILLLGLLASLAFVLLWRSRRKRSMPRIDSR